MQVLARLCVQTALGEKEVQTYFAKKLQKSREKVAKAAATAAAATATAAAAAAATVTAAAVVAPAASDGSTRPAVAAAEHCQGANTME